jgi:hypothetical protein
MKRRRNREIPLFQGSITPTLHHSAPFMLSQRIS